MNIGKYTKIINSKEYINELDIVANRIVSQSKRAPNEATIESNFDCELFAFFREKFQCLGFEYNPIKEKNIGTCRNILSSGRADTAISSLIIEFKQPKTLKSDKQKSNAISQIIQYIDALIKKEQAPYHGFVTDGVIGCFIESNEGSITAGKFYPLNGEMLHKIIACIVNVKLLTINAKTLVKGICNPPDNNGAGFKLMLALYNVLKTNVQPKTLMLFNEWMQLFNLAHDDISKQQAIIDRRKSLEKLFNTSFTNVDNEYLALFALQTAYAIIIKVIAFKVISQIRYKKSLINFYDSIKLDSDALRSQMADIENGAIFIKYGITNLLEGDFFSWYTNSSQWDNAIYDSLKNVFEELSKYANASVTTSTSKSHDFFKELYETMIPSSVRHSLGEYYTKKWLASCVVDRVLNQLPSGWKALDPCCGSGTFLSVLIDRILEECKDMTEEEKAHNVLSRVKGVDLNPIASLTARVNYFINICHLLKDLENVEIPVYLGDSSYIPEKVQIGKVTCLKYSISTLKEPIEILIPASIVQDTNKFSHEMNRIEGMIKASDTNSIITTLKDLCNPADINKNTLEGIKHLAEELVSLEQREWNGIWARILTNFLTTANMGKFDLIVGNPPWVDWKSLPSGYRDKVKNLCISKKLFSGDSITGGINLNICALITSVVAQNWLTDSGILGFLMPEPLIFQQSYEGFRNLYINDESRLYFSEFVNWNKAGHPFFPVTQKFLTYYMTKKVVDYKEGVDVFFYKKKVSYSIDTLEMLNVNEVFDVKKGYLANCHRNKNFFTYVDSKNEAKDFRKIAGDSFYIGREGVEFYPQELMVFKLSSSGLPNPDRCTALENIQNKKSKYKVPKRIELLETAMLRPMIKGKNIIPFHVEIGDYIVPFPYERNNSRVPISMDRLIKIAPRLAKYYNENRRLLEQQTGYNDRIIGKNNVEFYALARTGDYNHAKHYVVFRDNTKWAAAVITTENTPWGGKKTPVFQNHAVSICERTDGKFINLDEAHYICSILNSSIVTKYMNTSSDSRSFPIRPRIKIPEYDKKNILHYKLVCLSKNAHKNYNNTEKLELIKSEISSLYIKILDMVEKVNPLC